MTLISRTQYLQLCSHLHKANRAGVIFIDANSSEWTAPSWTILEAFIFPLAASDPIPKFLDSAEKTLLRLRRTRGDLLIGVCVVKLIERNEPNLTEKKIILTV